MTTFSYRLTTPTDPVGQSLSRPQALDALAKPWKSDTEAFLTEMEANATHNLSASYKLQSGTLIIQPTQIPKESIE